MTKQEALRHAEVLDQFRKVSMHPEGGNLPENSALAKACAGSAELLRDVAEAKTVYWDGDVNDPEMTLDSERARKRYMCSCIKSPLEQDQ